MRYYNVAIVDIEELQEKLKDLDERMLYLEDSLFKFLNEQEEKANKETPKEN